MTPIFLLILTAATGKVRGKPYPPSRISSNFGRVGRVDWILTESNTALSAQREGRSPEARSDGKRSLPSGAAQRGRSPNVSACATGA